MEECAVVSPTYKFLGTELGWLRCRVELYDPHGQHGGTVVHLDGLGRCVIRLQRGQEERRFSVKLDPREVEALFRLVLTADLVALAIPESGPPQPGERRPVLVLHNSCNKRFALAKWSHQPAPAFERVYEALLALRKKVEGRQPDFTGPFDPKWRPEPS